MALFKRNDTHHARAVAWFKGHRGRLLTTQAVFLEIGDAPASIEVALLNYPDIAPTGAGEPTIRCIPAAVANAFFDATGVRLRRAPLTAERVKAALARA